MERKIMNKEIALYPIYLLNKIGQLIPINCINSTNDYDHLKFNLHHYIEYAVYTRNKEWYEERGIKQKLILMPIPIHEQLHFIAIKNLTDEQFKQKYKISRWELIYNRKHEENRKE